MRVATFGGKKWVVDLEWELMPNEAPFRQEIKSVVSKTDKPYGVAIEYEGALAVGLSKKPSKLFSAAAMLAAANQKSLSMDSGAPAEESQNDWIVIDSLADDEYWLCVIKNGVPLPGTADTVHTLKDLQNRVTDLLEVDTYKIFSPLGEIKSYLSGVKPVDESGVAELTSGITQKFKLKKLVGISPVVVYIMGGMVALGLGYFALDAFLENTAMQKKITEMQKQQQQAQQAEQMEAQRAAADYEKLVRNEKQKQLSRLYAGIAGDPKVLLPAWINSVSDLPYPSFGWDMTRVECVFNSETVALNERASCLVFFKRGKYGTTRMLLDEIPTAQVAGNEAQVGLNLTNVPVELLANRTPDQIVLPNAALFAKVVMSQVQALESSSITSAVKPAVDAVFNPPTRPLTKAQIDAGEKPQPTQPINLGFSEGELILRGKNVLYFGVLFEDMNPMGMSMSRFRVDFKLGDAASWEATFKYFLKSEAMGSSMAVAVLGPGVGTAPQGSTPQGSTPGPNSTPVLPLVGLPGATR